MNSQTPVQECLSDLYETDKAKTMLNKRYEELRTQILELGSVGPLGDRKPLNSRPPSATATQWWERESGQIGKEFNLIIQKGMVTWLQVWLDLKPMGDTDTDKNADANTGTESTNSPCKMLLRQRKKNIQPEQGRETRKKSNGEGGGTQDRGGIILDCPGALVGVLSDIVYNAINLRQGSLKG